MPPPEEVRALGEECPGDFFRIIVESLADSFDSAQAAAYDRLMAAWGLVRGSAPRAVPNRVDAVYVLSRVTLGADIKISSLVLDAMKHRFPEARIVFVAGPKSIELYEADPRLEFLEAAYPRSGPVSLRIAFGHELRERLSAPHSIVIDPDSRMTQLGLIPPCDSDRYFHFPSRVEGPPSNNLTDLTAEWLVGSFGVSGHAYIAPKTELIHCERPAVAVSLGVGENEAKRIPGDFEARLIRLLGERYRTIHIDRGAGGEEASLVTAAVEASGVGDHARFWEGSFAGFASIVAQSDFYAGYDSAGQHAAAAAGIPLLSVFAGAPSDVFRARWEPTGPARRTVVNPAGMEPEQILEAITPPSF
jgi:ADP-heptose:LPS heptosyltransferase